MTPEQAPPQAGNSSTELSFAMEEMELVIAYLCRTAGEIDQKLIHTSIEAKRTYVAEGVLSAKAEADFWLAYRQLIESIKPASLTSIQETNPSTLWQQKHPGTVKRVKRIPLYYGFAVCLVILFTVGLQTYYMIGIDVLQKTYQLFEQRSELRDEINKLQHVNVLTAATADKVTDTAEIVTMKKKDILLDQEFDANRVLLYRWNKVWQGGTQHQATFSYYDDYKYHYAKDKLKQGVEQTTAQQASLEKTNKNRKRRAALQQQLRQYHEQQHKLEKERNHSISRNLFFSGRLSAVYVVDLLEGYLLPLLFGCLGAFTLVLRSIHSAFQDGTFTLKSCLDYNLRILLGGVTGISSGMFMGDSESIQGQYSPMVMAFLIGYNVEILFAMMDNLAKRLSIESKDAGDVESKGHCSKESTKKAID
ncbi:MAG: hypothetical protein MJK04_28585 [Psychrosphaera sp.]|nr:hypothetical protein [Psychrosphaera sp.]